MSHSHSQILALPVIPPTASARIQSMKQHFEQTGECALCQVTQDELTINESKHFKSVVPFAATFPFEIWIIPRHHSSHFHELDHDKVMWAFAMLLNDIENGVFFICLFLDEADSECCIISFSPFGT